MYLYLIMCRICRRIVTKNSTNLQGAASNRDVKDTGAGRQVEVAQARIQVG